MNILSVTIHWMIFNVELALIAVAFGYLMYKISVSWIRAIAFILWLLFIPNTIYLFTDIINFYRDSQGLSSVGVAILIFLYSILLTIGLFSFVMAMYPFEKLLKLFLKGRRSRYIPVIIVSLNLLIGFGMVLGRVLRVNSWDVFTHPNFVLWAIEQVFNSANLFVLALLFGLFGSLLYYTCKGKIFAALYLLLRKRKPY